MPSFIRIGDAILNLGNILRVERGDAQGTRPTVLVYFTGEERSQTQFTDAQAEAVWRRFSDLAEAWDVPEPIHHSPAGAGRTSH
jgi:hypothetical protein